MQSVCAALADMLKGTIGAFARPHHGRQPAGSPYEEDEGSVILIDANSQMRGRYDRAHRGMCGRTAAPSLHSHAPGVRRH